MTFTVEVEMYPGSWDARFAFDAENKEEANDRLFKWTRYQGFSTRETRIREATEHEAKHWLHNEYVS